MTQTERMLVSIVFVIVLGSVSWLMGTVSINSGRLLVLEQRANNHSREMLEMRQDVKEHRVMTELNGKR
jgi:hypothetical protein